MDKGTGRDNFGVAKLPVGTSHENFHDHGLWHIKWRVDKYFGVDKDAIMPHDVVVDPLLDRIRQSILHGAARDFDLCKGEMLDVFKERQATGRWPEYDGLVERLAHSREETLEKFLRCTPNEVVHHDGNLLMYGGVSCLWEALIGNGTASAGQALTYFNNGQAAIGVGDSTTAAAATQTDLQASSNKLRVGMVATYPQHTDATTSGAATITYQSSFGNSQANFAWQEEGIFNSSTAATGRMLNRVVSSLGTKVNGTTWVITGQITIS